MTAQLDDSRNNPTIWIAACRRLLNTLNVIERGIPNSNDNEQCDAELSAMMIAGFAFENAFKARYLKSGEKLYIDGKLNDSEWHRRMKGVGNMAEIISQVFKAALRRYYGNRQMPIQDTSKFRRGGNYSLF